MQHLYYPIRELGLSSSIVGNPKTTLNQPVDLMLFVGNVGMLINTMWPPPVIRCYVCWFRFAPVTRSLFAYHKPVREIGVISSPQLKGILGASHCTYPYLFLWNPVIIVISTINHSYWSHQPTLYFGQNHGGFCFLVPHFINGKITENQVWSMGKAMVLGVAIF